MKTTKSKRKKDEEMTAEEFINQPLSFFEDLFKKALKNADLTIKDKKSKKELNKYENKSMLHV